jgi:hypothetical protein
MLAFYLLFCYSVFWGSLHGPQSHVGIKKLFTDSVKSPFHNVYTLT